MSNESPNDLGERSGSYLGGEASTDPVVIATARRIRRVGYVVLVIVTICLVLPLLVGVISGVLNNEAWDAWTGARVDTQSVEGDPGHFNAVSCNGAGVKLIDEIGSVKPTTPAQLKVSVGDKFKAWSGICAAREPNLNRILQQKINALK